METEDTTFWHRPSFLSSPHEEPPKGDSEAGTDWLDVLKENWKVIGTGLAVLSLASIGLYAIFKTRSEAKKDNLAFLTEKQIRDKVIRAQTLKSRQQDWLAKDREMWSKLETEPVDTALDSVYDFLDNSTDFDLDAYDEQTLSSEVPSLGLKDIYVSPSKARQIAPLSPKQKQMASPNRVRVRDLLAELEGKSALLREAEATIERQAVVIKRANDNFEELTDRFKTEQRFRVEAEQHARLMEEQLERLQLLLTEQQQLRDLLEGELKAAQMRAQLTSEGEEAQKSLQIFEELRAQQVQAQDEIARLKVAYARVTSEKMQEKSLREVHTRQISQLVAEVDELRAKLQLRNPSPYAAPSARPTYVTEADANDSYFSPIQSAQNQGPKSMGFTIPPAAEVHRSRSILSKPDPNATLNSSHATTNPYVNSSSMNLNARYNTGLANATSNPPTTIARVNSESEDSSRNRSDDSFYNDYDSPLELTAELEELLSRTSRK